jgi:anti-anti-sigma regulatory factor
LPAECTLAEAEGLKLKLTGLLRNAKPVTLDLSAVRRIDTASMQLLAAFVRDRLAGDRAVALTAASPAFVEAAHLLGLSAALTGAGVAL